jgi:hypothetical protein
MVRKKTQSRLSRRSPGRPAMAWLRWMRVGPGLLLAIVAAALLWRGRPDRSAADRVASPAAASQRTMSYTPPPAAPPLPYVLEHGDELHLTPAQRRSLTALERRCAAETAALREALDRAAGQFRSDMEGRPASEAMRGFRERSAAIGEYSRRLAAARRACWEDAARGLTAAQRTRAEDRWRREMSGDR